MRPFRGTEIWNRELYYVVFYDLKDDLPMAVFEDPWEIVEAKNWSRNKSNYDIVMRELLSALRSDDHFTRMMGKPSRVYLIDKNDDEEEKQS